LRPGRPCSCRKHQHRRRNYHSTAHPAMALLVSATHNPQIGMPAPHGGLASAIIPTNDSPYETARTVSVRHFLAGNSFSKSPLCVSRPATIDGTSGVIPVGASSTARHSYRGTHPIDFAIGPAEPGATCAFDARMSLTTTVRRQSLVPSVESRCCREQRRHISTTGHVRPTKTTYFASVF